MAEQFEGKLFIHGKIVAKTGLHVGGSKTALDIGAIDLSVVKTAAGVPFIPGSSLKGKLRSLLAREQGSASVADDQEPIPTLFGTANAKGTTGIPSRLIVRDAFLDEEDFKRKREDQLAELELDYTESKWENVINRLTGTAEHPRQLERVPAGAVFKFELVYNVFDDGKEEAHLAALRKAMRLLQDDYLGGQGSRGYGRIEFESVFLDRKTLSDYEGDNGRHRESDDFLALPVPRDA
jgi:CRISPR-associated protein Csm3